MSTRRGIGSANPWNPAVVIALGLTFMAGAHLPHTIHVNASALPQFTEGLAQLAPAQPVLPIPYPAVPHGCTIVGVVPTEERFPLAHREDDSYLYADMDGQPYDNEAGYPVYPSGTWRDASGYAERH